MKKTLLLFALVSMTAMGYAQAEPDDLERVEGFFWKYDDVNKTATIISSYRWHSHGTLPDGSDDMVMGNCHCYSGDVVIPETAPNGYTVTGIGEQCFNGCDELISVKLPETLKTIGELAFQLCTKLTGISIPASVERLEHGCFNGAAIETLTIEDGDNPITIGSSYMVYGSLFYGMDALRKAYIGRNFTVNNPSAEETEGPKGLFYSCEYIEEVTMGFKVTLLHDGEFYACKSLKKAELGSSTIIPNYCFQYCESLARVNGSMASITEIGDYAFANIPDFGNGSTINLDIMTNLKTIGEGAYMESGASKAIIPASVEKVGDVAFGFMPNLTELQSLAVVPPTCSIFGPVSDEMYQTCKLYVPMGSEEAYKAADGWKNFYSIEAGINSIQTGAPFVTDSYSFNGQRIIDNHRGLTIQRTSDGRVRKVVIR